MKRWSRRLILLFGLVVISQLPFACRSFRLRRLDDAIKQVASQRSVAAAETGFVDYRGVMHVHSFLGGHSTGTFTELIAAAKANGLDFVIMTEHPQEDFDTSATALNGVRSGVLFINGNEVVTAAGDRLLLIPGSETANTTATKSTQQVIDEQKQRSGLAIVAYPNEFHNWQANGYDGVEIYNLFTNTQRVNRVVTFFDGLWSYRTYPDLMFANFFARPDEQEKHWDDAMADGNKKLVATEGNDAHSNVGLSLNDSTGKQLLGIKLDPYERAFHIVRTHILVEKGKPLTRESLLEAMARGHCYISFDLFGDPKGFSFIAEKGPEQTIMGDEITLDAGLFLKVSAPLRCRFLLFANGHLIDQKLDQYTTDFEIHERGAYRIEAYLDSLPPPAAGKPWIISNPIYVR